MGGTYGLRLVEVRGGERALQTLVPNKAVPRGVGPGKTHVGTPTHNVLK